MAWHFATVAPDGSFVTAHGGLPVVVGETLECSGPLELCQSGLHASKSALAALGYAQGSVLCRVELGGEMYQDADKHVARRRTAVWAYDASDVLRAFARRCALDVVHLWDAPDVVILYLKTGHEDLRAAARGAARAAARAAAWDAGGAAAWAAWDAARAAAWAAARDAARDAAQAAARDAARDAAQAKLRRRLTSMLVAGRPT